MTGFLTYGASRAEADGDGWEQWPDTAADQAFPIRRAWPWEAVERNGGQRALEVAAHECQRDITAARAARRFTTGMLRTWAMPDIVDDASLAVSELVANAVGHGLRRPTSEPHPVRLYLFRSRHSVVCMVTDPSNDPPILRAPDYVAESGRGLQLIASVSHRWGWTPLRPLGKAVWARFTDKAIRRSSCR
ncbi:hypothetical protein GCM10023194_51590 [Planotetraspora phitsanulokensis]|uniref:Histidine kinase/HSP90-like ATPase domain-containing protein n=1 Tax=Planotetraspora phitsanulokensis TaxID=575192 RepID=A0A8J3XGA1_9ACTN|nr:ATP-binding protein [Planotetraspora phitsanulokensis]GII39859.1 hypothetical protein Pph01_48620 [Planotetraspora phitsanulokensis]